MRKEGRSPRSSVDPGQNFGVRQLTLTDGGPPDTMSKGVKLFGKTPGMIVTVNGISVETMADSGAEVSLVTEEWYTQNLLPKQVVINALNVKITDANGRRIPCLGYVQVDLEVAGRVIKDCGLFVRRTLRGRGVVKGTRLPILLGMNILAELVQGWSSAIGERPPELSEEWSTCVRAVKARLEIMEKPLEWAVVSQEQNLVIPAGTRRVVQVFVPKLQPLDSESVLLEPLEESDGYWVPEGVCVFPSYTRVVKGKGCVAVANLGKTDVKLRPQWKVAKVSHGREVTDMEEPNCDESEAVSAKRAREYRQSLGVHVEESQMNENQLEQLDKVLYQYRDVFAENEQELGCATGVEHEIHLTSDVPIKLPYRHIPPKCMTEVKAHIKGLLEQGVIEESVGPYAAPIVLVRKKDQSLRLCVDYRRLNEVTVKDAFPLPRIQDTLDALAGAQCFSSFDLAAGYHQIKVRAADRAKTGFVTPFGHYQYIRCPMGLTNSPATFQRFMENVFSDHIFVTLLVYLDDLLLFSKSVDEHVERLEVVFRLLKKYGLKLKPSKCHILQPQVKYLGFVLSKEGISTDPEKISAVKEWPVPRTVKDVRAFVAFCSFYRRFIEGFAKVAAPLHALMGGESKTDVTKYWGKKETHAFEELKKKLTCAPVLKNADYDQPFVVETDASFDGLGAVLSQEYEGKLHPVAFASRGLRKSERNMNNYSSRKLELLALKWAVTEQFKNYLAGGKFVVLTDNNPLAHLQNAKLGAVESRWLGDLNRFHFEVKYRPGKENANADGLSRRPHRVGEEEKEIFREMWEKVPEDRLTRGVAMIKVWDHVQTEKMRDAQKACPVVGQMWMQMIGKLPAGEIKQLLKLEEFRKLWRVRRWLVMRDGVIFWKGHERNRGKWKVVLPVGKREEVISGAHDGWGHQGVARTIALVKRSFAWPGLQEDIKRYVARCKTCAVSKEEGVSSKTRLGTVGASRPWEVLAMDFTLLDPSRDGKETVLIVTDVFSKFALAFPTKNQRASTVAKILVEEIFNRFGIPERVHSDQGRNFESQLVNELCTYYGIEKSRTTPYHPQGNGVCERFNRTLHGMLSTLSRDQRELWPRYLSSLTAIYNSTPHAVTGFSPHYILFGVEPHLPMDRFTMGTETAANTHHEWVRKLQETHRVAWRAAKKNIKQYNEGNRRRRQEQAKAEALGPGQKVLLRDHSVVGRNKIQPKFAEEVWVIVEVLDSVSGVYRVRPESEEGHERVLHRSNLRPWNPPEDEESSEEKELQDEEEEVEMPDMTKVLERFGIKDSQKLSTIEEEEEVMDLSEVEGLADEEDSRGAEEGNHVMGPSEVERLEDEEGGTGDVVIGEPVQLRRSRRIAEQRKTGGNQCIVCDGCVREGTHKKGGGECNNLKKARSLPELSID